MIEEIVPAAAVVVATRDDVHDDLFPAEEAVVARAVEKRRREFVTARVCARAALARLGLPAQAIPSGSRGEPRWPDGVVGSITHCAGYRACAVARRSDLATIGIDAELDQPLPAGVLEDVSLSAERARLRELGRADAAVRWDRLLFSAKESVYKAWFPLAESWLGFEDAEVEIDPGEGRFSARLLVPGPTVEGRELTGFSGRWLARDGLLLTAIGLTANAP
jgi:4'-phosphopantetheinyl transferase EntD